LLGSGNHLCGRRILRRTAFASPRGLHEFLYNALWPRECASDLPNHNGGGPIASVVEGSVSSTSTTLIVFSKSGEEHVEHVREALDLNIIRAGLRLKVEKCRFGVDGNGGFGLRVLGASGMFESAAQVWGTYGRLG
jgi:hypothetical protein